MQFTLQGLYFVIPLRVAAFFCSPRRLEKPPCSLTPESPTTYGFFFTSSHTSLYQHVCEMMRPAQHFHPAITIHTKGLNLPKYTCNSRYKYRVKPNPVESLGFNGANNAEPSTCRYHTIAGILENYCRTSHGSRLIYVEVGIFEGDTLAVLRFQVSGFCG